ncbi:CDC27 family protein [Acidovorax sp. sif1233]|uniref:tetratricopeptide repeat protein n=1 Tax=Acidovorax sp. sif1233 TaxID=2854792 RepID=UPI001C43D760|nr:AAA-like domain-containing protein [Acidovorax sp. sif1233]MBV7454932.1 CDC27 family protein [Acidovorax sp. sif1233]
MTKKLRAYTIIPPELYVPREADRQVSAILEDLGRPGYVLVARQMGKTNLILHARKTLSKKGDLFAYLDASNRIPDARSFFRNIIDVCCENPIFDGSRVAQEIREHRRDSDLLPHKEHEYELAIICKSIEGRLIICLDEIDALVGVDYSDQIFSFIRSTYFSGRSNYEAFYRLGYLLSGVAEPSDIIKNKDVSPFNIGAKIYLEDFSRQELGEFIEKAKLKLPSIVIERLYEWTNGHPRMTWDVASALEDGIISGIIPDRHYVDSIIQKLYFGDLDFPPVDQVKKLVVESKEIRDALMSIHYDRGSSVNEAIRARLYLAGISRMDHKQNMVEFKNKIFEEALSEKYILNVSPDETKQTIETALHLFSTAEYQRALFTLESIGENSKNAEVIWLTQYWTARSQYSLGQYEEAIASLTDASPRSDKETLQKQSLIGKANLQSGNYLHALEILKYCAEATIEWMPGFEHKLESIVDYSRAALESGRADYKLVEEYCKAVVAQEGVLLNGKCIYRSATNVLVDAYICLAKAARENGNTDHGRKFLESADRYAVGATKIRISLLQFDLNRNPIHKRILLEGCVQALRDVKRFSSFSSEDSNTIEVPQLVQLLVALDKLDLGSHFRTVVSHLIKCTSENEFEDVCVQVCGLAIQGGNRYISVRFLEGIISDPGSEGLDSLNDTIGLLLSIERSKVLTYGPRFVGLFENGRSQVGHHNLHALIEVFIEALKARDIELVERSKDIISKKIADEDALTGIDSASLALIRDIVVVLQSLQLQDSTATPRARALITRLNRAHSPTLPFFPADYFSALGAQIHSLLINSGVPMGRKEGRKIGRNQLVLVRYKTGLKKGKHKKFAGDIEMGLCDIVEIL